MVEHAGRFRVALGDRRRTDPGVIGRGEELALARTFVESRSQLAEWHRRDYG
jgi:hypothetical protein